MPSSNSSPPILDKDSLIIVVPPKLSPDSQPKIEDYTQLLEQLVKRQKKQLKEAERLAAIGQTAGMVGHDIRNPLQAIICELYLARLEIQNLPQNKTKHAIYDSIAFIEEQVNYINKIVSDLQDYARPLRPEFDEVNIKEIIEASISTIAFPQNIHLNMQTDKKIPKIKLDPLLLKRVLVNLMTNSVQAMPNGGKLTIKTCFDACNLQISVEDTGVGIPNEVKHKIFQPLMTTKSKGQGFGLAVAKRLVEAQNGAITFESERGVGTQFTITFPLTSTGKNLNLLDFI
ncbi:MAG: two-component system sensor histidine kinase NtrB [Candidatus Bathyarchaeia archaeon]|jgi:signal transduction histidine kinase